MISIRRIPTLGVVAALLTLAILVAVRADRAEAKAPIFSFLANPTSTQAGGHPDLHLQVRFRPDLNPELPCDCNVPKDITINTPPGVFGIPQNIPRCPLSDFALGECSIESQVGVSYVDIGGATGSGLSFTLAVFNMVPRNDQAGLVAIELPGAGLHLPIFTSFTVRTESDYGLESKSFGLIRGFLNIGRIDYIFWGVPGDPAHDALRFPVDWGDAVPDYGFNLRQFGCGTRDTVPQLLQGINPLREPDGICADSGLPGVQPVVTPYNETVNPFLTNPTNCSGALQSNIEVLAYDRETDQAVAPYPPTSGCDQLSFDPSLTAKPTTTEADAATGLDIDLRTPAPTSPYSPSPSQIRATAMTLPEGFTINTNAADGKTSCTDGEAHFSTREEAQCPENAKIGTLQIHSSALPGVLPGAIYLGEPLPGYRYRIFLTADGFSLHIKLAGYLNLDPDTGQVEVRFDDLPQAIFQRFTLHIFGGERGPLATPTQCGSYPVKTLFVPWDNELPSQTSTQFFTIDSGPGGAPCPPAQRPFEPELNVGVTDNTGGQHTKFLFDLSRRDGDQTLRSAVTFIPPGLSAAVAGIPYCPDPVLAALAQTSYLGVTELAAPTCPASQVGTSVASAGAGSRPTSLPGRVYLAGPYEGSPLSIAVVTPAVSGPFDLGNVVVRIAVAVDPVTARVSAIASSLPQIVEGIPLRLRRVLLTFDRPRFFLNPTNCSRFSITEEVTGDQGAFQNISVPFQVANCRDLSYAPQLSIRLTGGVRRRGHPAIHTVFRTTQGDANTRAVTVTLPAGQLLDNAHIETICTRVQFAANTCPKGSKIGRAKAYTPLLDQPLEGYAYLRSSSNKLPDLVVDLKGQVRVQLVARIDSVNGRLRAGFADVPDVPVSKFVLDLEGGKKGLLINSESLCDNPKSATVRMTAQNGKRLDRRVGVQTACGSPRKKRPGGRTAG